MTTNKGRFKKGQRPWNKGLKGWHGHRPTEFKKGEMVGPEHHTWKGGVQRHKGDCAYLWAGCNKRVRRPRAVYEEYYGAIAPGHVIWHIDGDKDNDNPLNLEAISRGEMMRRNSNRRQRR